MQTKEQGLSLLANAITDAPKGSPESGLGLGGAFEAGVWAGFARVTGAGGFGRFAGHAFGSPGTSGMGGGGGGVCGVLSGGTGGGVGGVGALGKVGKVSVDAAGVLSSLLFFSGGIFNPHPVQFGGGYAGGVGTSLVGGTAFTTNPVVGGLGAKSLVGGTFAGGGGVAASAIADALEVVACAGFGDGGAGVVVEGAGVVASASAGGSGPGSAAVEESGGTGLVVYVRKSSMGIDGASLGLALALTTGFGTGPP